MVHKLVVPSFVLEKSVQGSYSQSHSKFGKTAGMQCACNAPLAVCWAKFRKESCWNSFDLDFVLDLGDNLFKDLGLHRYLDASYLPEHIGFHGDSWAINKTYLHDGEVIIGTRFLFNPFFPCSRSAALLFIKTTVAAIIFHYCSYYLYDSHNRDSRGFRVTNFLVSNRLKITLKLFI